MFYNFQLNIKPFIIITGEGEYNWTAKNNATTRFFLAEKANILSSFVNMNKNYYGDYSVGWARNT